MSEAFVGEVRLLPYLFAPENWLDCNGQLISVSRYQVLFTVVGTTFGGNGQTTFGIPDLRGRAVTGVGNDPTDPFDPVLGSSGGTEAVTLTTADIPQHTHLPIGATQPNPVRTNVPANNYLSAVVYRPSSGTPVAGLGFFDKTGMTPTLVPLNPGSVSTYAGQSKPHENRQPYLAMRFCICFDGQYPVRP